MHLAAHLFDISHATDVAVLLAYRNDVLADDLLDAAEKEGICRAIEIRITTLIRKK
jgi:hypothetical protein